MGTLQASIVRCASCAAPLDNVGHADVVTCRYCKAQNHVAHTPEATTARLQRFQVAADEAQAMAADVETRGAALMQEFESLLARVHAGEPELAPRALELYEGFIRLQYLPTLHMYGAWGSDDPRVAKALHDIDAAVAASVASMAESLPG
ncbi:MAG: hypothetical protein AAGA54_25640 [Myxococcota bacterium]